MTRSTRPTASSSTSSGMPGELEARHHRPRSSGARDGRKPRFLLRLRPRLRAQLAIPAPDVTPGEHGSRSAAHQQIPAQRGAASRALDADADALPCLTRDPLRASHEACPAPLCHSPEQVDDCAGRARARSHGSPAHPPSCRPRSRSCARRSAGSGARHSVADTCRSTAHLTRFPSRIEYTHDLIIIDARLSVRTLLATTS